MQQRPDVLALLRAVESFLTTDVRPAVTDRAIRFRLLIASNLLSQAAAELEHDDALRGAELASLRDALQAPPRASPTSSGERAETIAALDTALAAMVRNPNTTQNQLSTIRMHLLQTLGDTLETTDPRFDRSLRIE